MFLRPDLPLKLVVQRERMLLYRDWSGASLHKRGWRPIQVKSPLNESTAAGLLLIVSRIAHAVGLRYDNMAHPGRAIGAGGTMLVTLAAAGYSIWMAVRPMLV